MTHDELRALLPWYVNHGLGEDEHEMAKRHVESCPDCAREVKELRVLLFASRQWQEEIPEPSADLLEKTCKEIERDERKRAVRKLWRIPLSLVASLIVAGMLGLWFVPSDKPMNHIPQFSTGGNAYSVEVILELAMDGKIDIQETIELMSFAP